MRSKVYVQYRILHLMVVLALVLAALPPAKPVHAVSGIVISQVYGGGGNGGSTYKNDFIELYNRGSVPVDVTGWSVQYTSATGTTWQVTNLNSRIMQPGTYYLIQEAMGAGGTTNLPTPDATGTIPMSGTVGKVALVNTTAALTGACPTGGSVVDFVGFGTTANCYEGTGPTPAPSNTLAVLRKANGATDTDVNSADFATGAPTPRNSLYAPTGVGVATPGTSYVGGTTLLTVTVTPGTNPVSTVLAVTVDLSSIGGLVNQTFYDNGTSGDVTSGDNTFSFQVTIGAGVTVGAKSLPVTVSDAQSRRTMTNIALMIAAPTNPSGTGLAIPASASVGDSSLLTVAVTLGAYPPSTGLAVTVDLSTIGGSTTQTFYDDGTNGDVTGGDNTFSFRVTIPGGTSAGAKSLLATISDAQSRNGSASISLTIAPPTDPSGVGTATPASGSYGATTLLTVTVTPGTGPISTGVTVTADLSAMGGSNPQAFFDDGTHGDGTPSDNIFSFQITAIGNPAVLSLPVDIDDAQLRHAATTIGYEITAPTVTSTNPANGATNVAVTSPFVINFSESVNVTSGWYSFTCGGDSVTATASATQAASITLTPDVNLPYNKTCTVTLDPTKVTSVGNSAALIGTYTWSFGTIVDNCPAPSGSYPLQANIGTVQGTGTSPVTGNFTVKGTITNRTLNKNTGVQYGLYIQDSGDGNTDTSDGLFVYTSTQGTSLAVGTAVMVSGTVGQYKNNTQITPTTGGVVACGNAATITPVTVNLPTDSDATILLEKYENMLVHLPQTFTIDQNYFMAAYGQITISPNGRLFNPYNGNLPGSVAEQTATVKRSMLVLDDNNYAADPNPPLPTPYISRGGYPYTLDFANITRAGDLILGDAETGQGLTGILDQGAVNFKDTAFSPWYRLQPTVWPTITAGNLRTTAATNPGGNVKVAGFNLENYFTTMDDGTNPAPYDGTNTPRGANNADEFARQKAKTVKSIIGLGADVTGVIELENNGPTAISDLLTALNAQAGAGTYAYVVDGLPTAAQVIPGSPTSATADYVKVGIFYKPAVVTPVGSAIWSPADIFSRQPLAQTFKVNASGEKFTVVVNHFKSKSSCPSSGDVDTGQGCWNLKRVAQANELINFINTTLVPVDPDVIALGDFNANGEEDPIKTLTNTATTGYLVNTLLNIPAADRYTYVFDGQAGYIDQMLVTPSLDTKRTGVTVWHINADESVLAGYNTEGKAPLAGYPADAYDASVPNRSSDHDPVLLGLYLNDAPQVANVIPNQSVVWGTPNWNFAFAANTFSDANLVNGDVLTYSATLADNSPLPAWLTFTPATRTFSGTPNVLGTVSIKVTATDRSSASASTTFDLTVTTVTLDADVTEWPTGSLLGANSTEFRVTWDDDFWYFSVKGGLDTSNFFMVGIDADPDNHTTNTGGTVVRCGATFPTQNKPDFILTQRQSSYLRESFGWDGADWNQASWNPVETGDYDFSGSANTYEVKLRKSAVFGSNEDTSPVGFYMWLSNTSCQPFNAWPPENYNGWTGGDQFLYAHTYFATTDAGRVPSAYNTRVGWDTQTLSSNSTAYNFFGMDSDATTNPWLRMTTSAAGAGGATCSVTAQLVGNRAFTSPTFVGVNRYIDFTFNTCTNVNVDVQMRYEQNEVVGASESTIQFYHCSLATCLTTDWLPVTGVTYTRDTTNNNLLLSGVAQDQFSKWMGAGPLGPTAITFNSLSARSAASTPVWIGLGLLLAVALVFWRKYFGS